MKKIIITICCFALGYVYSFAQENSSATTPSKQNGANTTSAETKKSSAEKKAKTSNTAKAKATHPEDKNTMADQVPAHSLKPTPINKKINNGLPYTEDQINNIIREEIAKDPTHPMLPSEMEKRKAKLRQINLPAPSKNASGNTAMNNGNIPNHLQKPLTDEERKRMEAQGVNIPPPPPPLPHEVKNVAPADPNDMQAPKFEFTGGNSYDYGEIVEDNTPTPHDFEFTNVGKKPLIIQEAHGSCGCTVPTYSKEPVLPGHKSIITVNYSSRGRVGPIHKDVTITSNAIPSPVVLHISGSVKANPQLGPPTQPLNPNAPLQQAAPPPQPVNSPNNK